MTNNAPEATIKPIGPGQTVSRIARFSWRAAWPFARRRPVLVAWLVFAVVASGLPFLLYIVVYEPDDHGAWVAAGGGVHRWSVTRALGEQLGAAHSTLEWEPNAQQWATFTWDRSSWPGLSTQGSVLLIGAPVWPFLLAPTLLVLAVQHGRHTLSKRRQNREIANGRTPCPACGYDATGLEVCPECGVTITPKPPTTEPATTKPAP